MALNQHTLRLLMATKPKTVLSLGFPDIVVSRETLKEITGIDVQKSSSKHQQWHGAKDPLPDTEEFFTKLGASLTCTDFKALRGNEKIVDLNFPNDLGQFDLVIDPGTLEHCFNIAQAAFNAANAVKLNGHILHVNPISMVNHGFYNLCPTWYFDFYQQNGFQILEAFAGYKDDIAPLPPVERIDCASEVSAYVLAKHITIQPLAFPIQAKYRRFL